MNERTKQLWEESQQWNGSDDGRGGLKILESIEKFAELIVRECANLPFKSTGEMTTIGEIAVSEMILKHFGVEE